MTDEELFDQNPLFRSQTGSGCHWGWGTEASLAPQHTKFPGHRAQSAATVLWKRSETKLKGVYLLRLRRHEIRKSNCRRRRATENARPQFPKWCLRLVWLLSVLAPTTNDLCGETCRSGGDEKRANLRLINSSLLYSIEFVSFFPCAKLDI